MRALNDCAETKADVIVMDVARMCCRYSLYVVRMAGESKAKVRMQAEEQERDGQGGRSSLYLNSLLFHSHLMQYLS